MMETYFWLAKELHIGYSDYWAMDIRDVNKLSERLIQYYRDERKKVEDEIAEMKRR
jgi:hypothetical protein